MAHLTKCNKQDVEYEGLFFTVLVQTNMSAKEFQMTAQQLTTFQPTPSVPMTTTMLVHKAAIHTTQMDGTPLRCC